MNTAHAASYASICAHYFPLRLSSQRNLLLYRAMGEPRWASGQFTASGRSLVRCDSMIAFRVHEHRQFAAG